MERDVDGLPKYGVTLSGSPKNPVIENRPGIAYVFKTADQNGHGSIYQQLLATSVQPAGGTLFDRVRDLVPNLSPQLYRTPIAMLRVPTGEKRSARWKMER
jgi:hypothetical protein